MSNLSQFAPFAGGLKSFQTGYVATTTASSGSGEDTRFTDVTISAVVTAKAITAIYGNGIYNGFGPRAGITPTYSAAIAMPRLTSTTNLRISCNWNPGLDVEGGNTGISGRWQVAEAN